MADNNVSSNAAFADALTRARQLAAKIGSGEKRPLEDGEGNAAKRPNNEFGGAPISSVGQMDGGSVMVENYCVPDHMVGLNSAGTNERSCTLTGTAQAIERAKDLIKQIIAKNNAMPPGGGDRGGNPGYQAGIPHTTNGTTPGGTVEDVILIPGGKVGLVIGKGGENLKRLQDHLGVRMIVIQDSNAATMTEKPMKIIGSPEKVQVAKNMVIEHMNSKEDNPPGMHRGGGGFNSYGGLNDFSAPKSLGEVIVPKMAVGVIIGKSGDMIKKIQAESGSRVQFKMGEDPNGPERTAILTGTPDQIQKATAAITELVNQAVNRGGSMGGPPSGHQSQELFYMHVPSTKTGLVIGKGGETIRQINAESGAHVELSRDAPPNEYEKVFIIKGSSQQIHHAQHLIRIKVGDIPVGTPVPPFHGNQFSYSYAPTSAPAQVQAAAPAQDPTAAWAAYAQLAQAQYYQQPGVTAGYPTAGQPQPTAATALQQQSAVSAAPAAQPQQPTGGASNPAPTINPVTGQPDYSAAWAEYYRQLGMHDQAAMIEQQAKATQVAAAAVAQPTAVSMAQQPAQASFSYPTQPQQYNFAAAQQFTQPQF